MNINPLGAEAEILHIAHYATTTSLLSQNDVILT